MGIYDRDYYRSSRGGFLESISSTTQVCKWLLIINIGVFVIQMFTGLPTSNTLGGEFTRALCLDTENVFQVWRLLTCAFLHGDVWHILFNMLFLWWFGRELESIYGSREFLTFYLIAAVLSSLAFVASSVVMTLSGASAGPRYALGASGAVTAVLLVFACHFPKRQLLLFFLIPVPIWLFVGFILAKDIYGLLTGNHYGTAVEAHLGGAAFGFLYFRYGWRVSPFFTQFRLPKWRRRQPRLRVWRDEERPREPVATVPHNPVDEQMEAKIDAILAKIKRSGKESLTEQENEILLKASEIYQKRRS